MIVDDLIAKHSDKHDLHITRVMCSWVVVSDGRVIEVERSNALHHCPLQSMLSQAGVEEYISDKMREFGHFTPLREVSRKNIAVPFGTSEMLMYALRKGSLDCAVTVCDGAGTVVSDNPDVVQGIGARMNGLFHTSPIPAVLGKLRELGATVFDDAAINQVRGIETAARAGRKRIGVTVNLCRGEKLADIREAERRAGVSVTLAGICSTGAGEERALEVVQCADIAWSCASAAMRRSGSKAILQLTHGIPIFVYTRRGTEVLAAYSDDAGAAVIAGLDSAKQYLLATTGGGKKVKLGSHLLWLTEQKLPVAGKHAPQPLR